MYIDFDVGYFSLDVGDDGWGLDDEDELRFFGWGIFYYNMDFGGKMDGLL